MTSGRSLEQECAELIRENNAIRTQRDELVKALEELKGSHNPYEETSDTLSTAWIRAHALLTRIKDQP